MRWSLPTRSACRRSIRISGRACRRSSRTPYDKTRTLFVDDSLPVLRSARTYGIAQLLAVCNPDSQQPHKDCGEFAAIASFAQVMPE